ncbi:MAG: hypothetical protein ACHRXM_39125 [Isosphaerales bacterium]
MVVSLLDGLLRVAGCYAAARPGQSNQPTYIGLALLAVLLVVALVKAYRVWGEIHDVEEPDSPGDLLASFERAHAAGELDDEEFERVRDRLKHSPTFGIRTSSSEPPGEATSPPEPRPPLEELDKSSASASDDGERGQP